nr:hypothetical protein [Tanacetum cinerariifolium]
MYAKCGLVDLARAVFDTLNSKNPISWTAMISGYAQSGQKAEAVKLLREMKDKSLYTWTALVSGLIQSGHFVTAFHLFIEMRKEGIKIIDPFVLSSVIIGSANLAALELGKELHCLVSKLGFECEPYISNALVDMYAKCSDIADAKTVFCSIVKKDVVSWTSIIVGLAQHGKAKEALSLYDDMISNGVKPNEVDEAVWASLLSACKRFGKTQMGIRVADHLMGLGVKDPSSFILLSNAYAGASMWENVAQVRKLMADMDIKKEPGYSCVHLGKESEVFHAGETSHS